MKKKLDITNLVIANTLFPSLYRGSTIQRIRKRHKFMYGTLVSEDEFVL